MTIKIDPADPIKIDPIKIDPVNPMVQKLKSMHVVHNKMHELEHKSYYAVYAKRNKKLPPYEQIQRLVQYHAERLNHDGTISSHKLLAIIAEVRQGLNKYEEEIQGKLNDYNRGAEEYALRVSFCRLYSACADKLKLCSDDLSQAERDRHIQLIDELIADFARIIRPIHVIFAHDDVEHDELQIMTMTTFHAIAQKTNSTLVNPYPGATHLALLKLFNKQYIFSSVTFQGQCWQTQIEMLNYLAQACGTDDMPNGQNNAIIEELREGLSQLALHCRQQPTDVGITNDMIFRIFLAMGKKYRDFETANSDNDHIGILVTPLQQFVRIIKNFDNVAAQQFDTFAIAKTAIGAVQAFRLNQTIIQPDHVEDLLRRLIGCVGNIAKTEVNPNDSLCLLCLNELEQIETRMLLVHDNNWESCPKSLMRRAIGNIMTAAHMYSTTERALMMLNRMYYGNNEFITQQLQSYGPNGDGLPLVKIQENMQNQKPPFEDIEEFKNKPQPKFQ